MDKEDVIYICNGILAMKKKELMPFSATWMDLENIILSEMSDSKRQILYDIIYMWNLKIIQMNSFIRQKESHRHRKQTLLPKGKGWEG